VTSEASFPFSAIVGMEDMHLALVLNAVSPAIGGVLIRGEKGTAKSTAVRALAGVLPDVAVVPGCRFSCNPEAPDARCPDGPHQSGGPAEVRSARVVELPVGASEDRLAGSLDLERALTTGVKAFEPGLLAGAHRGVLYVDEVNLLHDHLVDLLLDAAALGTSYVEREGVSVRHASRFILVGTMNPEEGELRPQLLDRFGLTAEVAAPLVPALRAEVVRRRIAFDADPEAFAFAFEQDEAELATSIAAARELLPKVELGDDALERIGSVCAAFEVDGLRADIVIARTAIAHAAWSGRESVTLDDIRAGARLALPHRRRRNPFDAPGLDEQQLDDALGTDDPEDDPTPPGSGNNDDRDDRGSESEGDPGSPAADQTGRAGDGEPTGPVDHSGDESASAESGPDGSAGSGNQRLAPPSDPFRARRLEAPGIGVGAAGRRSRAVTETGRTVGAQVPDGRVRHLHLGATLVAAAPHQRERGRGGSGLILHRGDLREARREGRESNLMLFLVDASGSMAARARMAAVKGAVLSLLLDAYQRRDKIGLIAFRDRAASLLLPPTSSVEAASARLTTLPTGGRTPLEAGLLEAHSVLARERLRDPRRRPLLVIVTDGRYTSGQDPKHAAGLLRAAGIASIVVDCEFGPVRLGLAGSLAGHLGGSCLQLGELGAAELAESVRILRQVA
jgi:magnesium chelatase subunit D